MQFKTAPTLICAIWIFPCFSTAVWAKESKFNEQLSVGEKAPDFSDLPGVDGKQHSLNEYKKAKAVVVVFTSSQCPVAVAYEGRLVALQKEYSKRGVQVVAVCSNYEAGHTLDEMKKRAESKKFNFPYLRDEDQKTARSFGATHTPHVFLLDGDRKIAYMGAIDDNEIPEKVSKHYLRDAIDSVLADKDPATTETRQFGCGIRYKRRPPARANRGEG
jgi:peroxiredoxin